MLCCLFRYFGFFFVSKLQVAPLRVALLTSSLADAIDDDGIIFERGPWGSGSLLFRTEVLVERHTLSFSTNSPSLIEVALLMELPIASQLLRKCAYVRPFMQQMALSMT